MANARWDANVAALQAETGMVNNEVALLAAYSTAGDGGGGLVSFSTPAPASRLVTGASFATPIVITTSAAHGLTAGQQVMIAGVAGNTAANGIHTIAILTSTTFQLVGSVGNAAYGGGGIIGDGDFTIPSGSATQGIWSRFAYVDLRAFGVVANDSTKGASNIVVIQNAISTYSGTGAVLVLPAGDIYLDRAVGKLYSVAFLNGINRISLHGQGMFATRIIQQGDAALSEWDAIVLDGSSQVELANFSIQQGTITNPNTSQQHSLIGVYANVVPGNNPTSNTQDTSIHHVYFGQCIGDAVRVVGDGTGTKLVDNLKVQHVIMRGQGIGLGSRSGFTIQRGVRYIEFCDFYIDGQKNSQIDMQTTGTTEVGTVLIHHGLVNNALGQTPAAISIGGNDATQGKRSQLSNVICLEGFIQVLGADNWDVCDVQVYASGAGPCAGGTAVNSPLIIVEHQNTNLRVRNLTLTRDTGCASGPLVLVVGVGTANPSRISFEGGQWLTRVAPNSDTLSNWPYVDIQSGDKCRWDGVHLRVEDPSPGINYGFKFRTTGGDITQTQILGCKIESTAAKLLAGVYFAATNSHSITGIQVCDLQAPGAVTTGLLLDRNGGTSFEANPVIQGCDFTGATSAWSAINSAAGVTFPVISGSKGGVCTVTGTVAPGGTVSAVAGSHYIKTTGEFYVSSGGTSWTQVTVP